MEVWSEQRKGSKIGYYLLYTFSWGMAIVFIAFFAFIFLGGISIIPIPDDNYKIALIVISGFVLGFITTWIIRTRNEKKYLKILARVSENAN